MKTGRLIKSADRDNIADEMALVNSYSRRELTPEEVYIFSVALCDNDVDRDYERFTVESLFALEKLFVGKTGIVDHDPKAGNMKARIISCRVEAAEGRKTALGDDYFRLVARAYIPRTEDNRALIEAIDAGIVREVSVGCAVGRTVCSVCGNDMHSPACPHTPGREYNGEICCGELRDPTDAYEFSFVAIPAQREAGVIKAGKRKDRGMKELMKTMRESDELTLSKKELRKLCAYIDELKACSEDGRLYRSELQREVMMAASASMTLSGDTAQSILSKLSTPELREIKCALAKSAAETQKPQLKPSENGSTESRYNQFTI